MSINPYLYFNGNCAIAFVFYKDVFKGTFLSREVYKDLPKDYDSSPDHNDKIMHVTLKINETILMGADRVGNFGSVPPPNETITLSYSPQSRIDADRVFKALTEKGGEAQMEMQETFWGSYFGTCKDPFGISWLINFNLQSS